MVTLPPSSLDPFDRLSLFNSPYPAHDDGRAVDLYPSGERAPSPVAGRVRETLTVDAPPRPYAEAHDHLILVDVDREATGLGDCGPLVARLLHADPAVEAGDRVAVGEPVGRLVRSGYFAPWVSNHLHLDVRPPDRHLRRASGSLPLSIGAAVEGVEWGGTGRVVETGETYVVVDAPAHPAPGERWVGVGVDGTGTAGRPALDGGLPHYVGGGLVGGRREGPVDLLGTTVGDADGRRVAWRDVRVRVDDHPAVGCSLFVGRDRAGTKVVTRNHPFEPGDEVRVAVEPGDGPTLRPGGT